MHKHRILIEVAVEGDEVRGVSVRPIADKQGENPDEGKSDKEILERNLAMLTSGITSLIHHGHQKGIKDSAESMKETIDQLNEGFINSGAEVVDNKNYKKETKINNGNKQS